jgi:hypothetical protein
MRRILILLPLLLLCDIANAQTNYDVSLIPKELMPYASAVIRNEEITTEVKDLDNMTYHVKRAITILNKNGDEMIGLNIFYDNITNIKYIKGSIYNEFGKAIQKITERDFEDEAVSDGFSLFQDDRVKHFKKAVNEYPYTIEYEYEIKSKQTLHFNDWVPVFETNQALEKSSYNFICKSDFNIRYKEFNMAAKAEIVPGKNGLKTYHWEIKNIKAIKDEPFIPNWKTFLSGVIVAPEKFAYGNVNGSFTNWKEMGKWEYDKLLSSRADLPAETIGHIKEITASIADPRLKAQKIYEYMQQKTHYISIQIGIGGFQPFPASEVDKLNYGDCKALVNYTRALLKVAGIDSWYCLVYGNRHEKISMINDFASMQGNHIILCVPFKNDTTWLECTNPKKPFGYLGDFTDDRVVLACTPEGGKLMHTPKYTTDENLEKRKASFVLSDAGELTGNMETVFKGADYEQRNYLIEEAPVERVKDIRKYYPINNLEVEKLEFKQDKSIKPVTTEDIKLLAKEYGAVNNDKFYFSLNSVDREQSLRQEQHRVNPIYINRGYTEEDEITYTLPKGYRLDSEPLHLIIEKPFGNFSAIMKINGDQLVYTRKFQLKDGTYSKDIYQDMVDFYQSVADADEFNVTLVKN